MASVKDSFVHYFQDSFQELKKVTWPTRNQAVRFTFIVLGFCVVASAFVGLLDLAFNQGYRYLVDYSAKINPPAVITAPTPEPSPVTTSETTIKSGTEQTTQQGTQAVTTPPSTVKTQETTIKTQESAVNSNSTSQTTQATTQQ